MTQRSGVEGSTGTWRSPSLPMPSGGNMRAQLLHLAELGKRTNVGIQVIPASRAANAGHVGAFTIASMDEADVLLKVAVDEDMMTDKRSSIRAALGTFDRVRLDALSGPESLELIMKVAEECNP